MPDVHQAPQSGETKILRLLRLARTLRQAAEDHDETWEDAEAELYELFYRQTYRLEDEIMASPPTCAEDMAAKFITATKNGEYCLDIEHPLFIEARAMTGVKPLKSAARRELIQSLSDAGAEPGETDGALRQRLLDMGHHPVQVKVAGEEAIHAFREACNLPTGTHPAPAGPSS